jgi:hypothetical protein
MCKEIGKEYRKKRDAELKIQRAVSSIHPCVFSPALILLYRVPKCEQLISRLPTKRRSASKEMFKSCPKKSKFKKRKSRVYEVSVVYRFENVS